MNHIQEQVCFLSPSLKFRTAGFPQYGFKRKFTRNLRRRC